MSIEVSEERFDELVDEGLRRIPRELIDNVNNVAIVVEDLHPDNAFAYGAYPTSDGTAYGAHPDTSDGHSGHAAGRLILGLYEGIALTERTSEYTSALPDKITLYRLAIASICETEEELVEQVAVTVIHELGHHFGIDDARLHELGWG